MVTLILRRVRELKARKKRELYVSFRNGFRPVTFRAFLSLHHSPTPEKRVSCWNTFLEEHFHSTTFSWVAWYRSIIFRFWTQQYCRLCSFKSYALLFRFFNQRTRLVSSSTWCKTSQLCSHYADFYLSPTKCWLPSLTAYIFHHKLPR